MLTAKDLKILLFISVHPINASGPRAAKQSALTPTVGEPPKQEPAFLAPTSTQTVQLAVGGPLLQDSRSGRAAQNAAPALSVAALHYLSMFPG